MADRDHRFRTSAPGRRRICYVLLLLRKMTLHVRIAHVPPRLHARIAWRMPGLYGGDGGGDASSEERRGIKMGGRRGALPPAKNAAESRILYIHVLRSKPVRART